MSRNVLLASKGARLRGAGARAFSKVSVTRSRLPPIVAIVFRVRVRVRVRVGVRVRAKVRVRALEAIAAGTGDGFQNSRKRFSLGRVMLLQLLGLLHRRYSTPSAWHTSYYLQGPWLLRCHQLQGRSRMLLLLHESGLVVYTERYSRCGASKTSCSGSFRTARSSGGACRCWTRRRLAF